MGIDVRLSWDGMTEEDKVKQAQALFNTEAGQVGYLRESYHGGPYATKLLVREAFESEDCTAQIPAAVMRERLTSVTEPARNCDEGHKAAMMLTNLIASLKATGQVPQDFDVISGGTTNSGKTTPMTVEEAVRMRYATVYRDDSPVHAKLVVKSFRDFVELAERKEKETGKPCTVYASY